ncbi:MAG: UDP-N-acetylmuramoyl-L-alanine--D-glutamate ligase [Clostridia bacterium]
MYLVYGLGASGNACLNLLQKENLEVAIFDDNKIVCPLNVEDRSGKSVGEALKNVTTLVLSPSINISNFLVCEARKLKIEIIGEIELAYRFCKAKICAITGTNGKTTTTMLINHIFNFCGVNSYALGNIGVPFASMALDVKKRDAVILEVSSFQLETTEKFAPNIAICLNITPDHLERHKTFLEYVKTKLSIFEMQKSADYAILNYDDEILRGVTNLRAQTYYYSTKEHVKGCYIERDNVYFDDGLNVELICAKSDLNISYLHNLSNALACLLVAKIKKFNMQTVVSLIADFHFPRHRIEYFGCYAGKRFFNDSKATNVHSTEVAINVMQGKTCLIMGGYDKGLSYFTLFNSMPTNITHILFVGANKQKLSEVVPIKRSFAISVFENIYDAVFYSLSLEVENVLFSPATSSFDSFNNYEERGDYFIGLVKEMNGEQVK